MVEQNSAIDRRKFVRNTLGYGASVGLAAAAGQVPAARRNANDAIQLGFIGVGVRGAYLAREFAGIGERTNDCRVAAICDVWEKRRGENAELHKCQSYIDYREVIRRPDIDAVVIATPDHWHATMALEAIAAGKDVYLEKPMTHTIEEGKRLVQAVKDNKRVLQVGSQTTSADQWWKARKAIADGMIGQPLLSLGSYCHNSLEGRFNSNLLEATAGPQGKGDNYIDWNMWLGPARQRSWDADRYFHFRKYWDYSGGIATDLLYHVVAPLNICWGEAQFPYRVTGSGGIYTFHDREVPDNFHLVAEYEQGHSVVLVATFGNFQQIPGEVRGREGSIIMVDHGLYEGQTDHITIKPEKRVISAAYKSKWGEEPIRVPVEARPRWTHMQNFLDCVRSRQKPVLDVETGFKVQVAISLSVQSYREDRVLFWDRNNWKVVDKPPRA